jgi:hypothetical protein
VTRLLRQRPMFLFLSANIRTNIEYPNTQTDLPPISPKHHSKASWERFQSS